MKYISPSGLFCWRADKDEFYRRYVARNRPPRPVQTMPMAVGSVFDGLIKAWVDGGTGRMNEWVDAYMEGADEDVDMTDESSRVEALGHGKSAWYTYKEEGGLGTLEKLLDGADSINTEGDMLIDVEGVPIRMKQDLIVKRGDVWVVLDWKVNGWMAKSRISPSKGWWSCGGGGHRDHVPGVVGDVAVDLGDFKTLNPKWWTQLQTYSWGVGTGDGEVVGLIHQVLGRDRVCFYGGVLGCGAGLLDEYRSVVEIARSDWFFRELSKEESIDRCQGLELAASAFKGSSEEDEWYNGMMGRGGSVQ